MISADQFRSLVSKYLMGDVDLDGFSRQFSALFDDVEDAGNAEAIEFSYRVESALADLSAGLISESSLRMCLSQVFISKKIVINPEFVDPLASRAKNNATYSPYAAEFEYA